MEPSKPLAPELFTISVDFDARLLRFKLTGLWDQKMFERYRQAILDEIGRFQNGGLSFDMLGDVTTFLPQHQFLNDAREELSKVAKKRGLRKCAIIVESALVKYQVARLMDKTYQYFASEQEALAWIRQ